MSIRGEGCWIMILLDNNVEFLLLEMLHFTTRFLLFLDAFLTFVPFPWFLEVEKVEIS